MRGEKLLIARAVAAAKDPGRYSDGGGQLLQRIAGLVQLRIPVLKLEKFKLTLHGDPTVLK